MNHFSDLTLSAVLKRNLAAHGFEKPTPVQAAAIPAARERRDLIATAQTGTGKTLAFVLPLLEQLLEPPVAQGVQAVILTPTRELALQIHETFAKLAQGSPARAAAVVGGLNENTQLRAIRQGAQALIATPGRLNDFLDRRLVKLGQVHTLVLDEADRMLDMGFLPAITRILEATPPARQTMFFSATIEKSVAHLIGRHLKEPVKIAIGPAAKPAADIDLHLYEVDQTRKHELLRALLHREAGSFLVFTRTKHGADRLARRLALEGVKAAAIHGDRTQNQRNRALRGFQEGSYRVLVATDVAARGIHVDGIAHVVNFDLPQVPEDFIHRVGRTGRAGRRGAASTFATREERGEIRRIERALTLTLARREAPEAAPAAAGAVAVAAPAAAAPRPARHGFKRSFGPARRRGAGR